MLALILTYGTLVHANSTAPVPAPPTVAPAPPVGTVPVANVTAPAAPTAAPPGVVPTSAASADPGVTPAAAPAAPLAALTPAELFARAKPLVFKLDTRLRGTHAEREHGTGFVVATDGRLATNYHVVADLIVEPEKYELFARGPAGDLPAKVLAVDPVNDVAIVKIERRFETALPVGPTVPPRVGDVLVAIGFPKSEDITIAQGNFNGERTMGFGPVIASSLPLNPGMSGGPCLDRFGAVVGVNRAIQRDAQNISYLSPNQALAALIERAAETPAPRDWMAGIVKDVVARETATLALPPAGERQRLGGFGFDTPVASTKCGQDKFDGLVTRDQEMVICQSMSLALLTPEQNALQITTVGASSGGTTPTPFKTISASYAKARAARAKSTRSLASLAEPAPKTACRARTLRNAANLDLTVRWCSVEVPQFPGLYDTYAKIDVRGTDGRATAFAQSYEGMSLPATGTYLQRFVEGLRHEK